MIILVYVVGTLFQISHNKLQNVDDGSGNPSTSTDTQQTVQNVDNNDTQTVQNVDDGSPRSGELHSI
jgi:hypothetical protein